MADRQAAMIKGYAKGLLSFSDVQIRKLQALYARGQSGNIIIDARNQAGMTADIANRGVARAYSADTRSGAKIQSITIITKQGTVYAPRTPK